MKKNMSMLLIWILLVMPFFSKDVAVDNNDTKFQLESNALKYQLVIPATLMEQTWLELGSSITSMTINESKKPSKSMVVEALTSIPGLDVVQSSGPVNVADEFILGAISEHTLIMVDSIKAI